MTRLQTLWRNHREFLRTPLFLTVLAAKLISGALFASHFPRDLFLPFITFFVDSHGRANPWNEFLTRGILDAFPYSSVMLGVLSFPQALGALLFGSAAATPYAIKLLLLRLPLVFADVLIYLILCQWFVTKWRSVLALYWCSPVLFYISYVHGQIDAIPTALLMLCLWYTVRIQPVKAGLVLGLGTAAKFNVAVIIPLVAFFFLRKGRGASRLRPMLLFLAAFTAAVAVFIGPLVASRGFQVLVLQAEQTRWIYDLAFIMPRGIKILLCPAVILMLILQFFSYREVTKDVLILYTGLLFTTLIVLVPPAPGWAYWSIPFLCYFLVRHDLARNPPFLVYNAAYLAYYLAFAPGIAIPAIEAPLTRLWIHGRDVLFTAMQVSIGMVSIWIYRVGVKSYVKYRTRQKTVSIGIAGDSASGKDTLARTFMQLLGDRNIVRLHGDDYHRWPRGHDAWKSQTHLDPRSNYFRQPLEHLLELKSGGVVVRSRYDHSTGQFGAQEAVHSNRFVIFEGLHPFLFERLREVFDLRIFLATNESLRRLWKLRRDTAERGHHADRVVAEMERRQDDSQRYLQPQAAFADWAIEYQPVDEAGVAWNDPAAHPELKVRHRVSTTIVELETLIDEFSRQGTELHVTWTMDPDLRHQVFEVKGTISSAEVEAIAYRVFPDLDDFLTTRPQWLPDLDGINQLVLLAFLYHRGTS